MAIAVTLEEAERQHIKHTLQSTGGRIKGPGGAADLLGMKPSTLYAKMKKLSIFTSTEKSAIPNGGPDNDLRTK